MIDREELAWAAGFFDGEGHAGLSRRDEVRVYPQVSVTQIHRDTLERFQRAVGGRGKIYGPYFTKSGVHGQYTWKVRRFEDVQFVMCALWPWLHRVKREQFAGMIETVMPTVRAMRRPRDLTEARCRRRAYQAEWARNKRREAS